MFFVNLPVVAVAIAAAIWLVPESKDRPAPKLDLPGLLLSVAAIGALVFTIIEAPEWGWASASSALGFLASLTLLAAFIRWELSVAEPMLPVRIFTNLRRRSRALRRARTG